MPAAVNATSAPVGLKGGGGAQTSQSAQMKALKKMGEQEFPLYTWYVFAGVIGLATLNNVVWTLWAWRRRQSSRASGSFTNTNTASPSNSLPSRLARAVSTAFTRVSYRWRIPYVSASLLEVFLTALYIVLLFTLEFTYTQGLTVKLWANRAGHIVAIQIPLIVALSAKHNVIGFFTGLSHEKLNLMHRMTSRVNLFMIWVHLFGTLRDRGLARWLHAPWVTCGLVAGIAITLLVLTSFAPIRRRFYEFFYASHMILAIVAMVCVMYHCYKAKYAIYIWPAFVVWGFDRVCRYLRFISFNSWFMPKNCSGTLELAASDTLLLTVKRRVPFGWQAGQHMFLSFPTVNPLQSHPFTLATVAEGKGLRLGITQELGFIVRVRNGLTRSLYDKVLETGTMQLPILVDGPYGAPPDISPFTTCIFVTGGSGITYTLPRCEDVISRASNNAACARRIVFIWAIRDKAHLSWIPGRLSKLASSTPAGVSLSIQIYITSGPLSMEELEKTPSIDSEKPSDEDNDDKKSDVRSLEEVYESVAFYDGRPDILRTLESEVKAAEGPVSIDASGPSPLLAAVRSALCAPFASPVSVLKGAQTVQLNVEEFSI